MSRSLPFGLGGRLACKLVSAVSIFAICAGATAAHAAIEEIVVSAQKRDQSIRDVPMFVTAFGSDFIDDTDVVTFDQLARYTPGLIIDTALGESFPTIALRGISTPGSQGGFESSVGVVIDGVFQARPTGLNIELVDIERVEVLRGPQGTLFGKNTTAGLLNIVTKSPTDAFAAEGQAYYGDYDELRLRGAVSGPLTPKVQARLSGGFSSRDAYAEALFPGAPDQTFEKQAVTLKLKALATDALTLQLNARYTRSDLSRNSQTDIFIATPSLAGFNEFVIGKPILLDDVFERKNDQDYPGFAKQDKTDVWLDATYDLGGFELISLSAVQWFDLEEIIDADNTSASGVYLGSVQDYFQGFQEIRLRTDGERTVDYQVGAQYFYQDYDSTEITGVGLDWATFLLGDPGLAGNEDLVGSKQKNNAFAVFAHSIYHASDRLGLTLGGRIDHEKKDYSRVQPASFLSFPLTADLDRAKTNWSATVSAQYDFTDTATGYVTWSRGAKGGGFNFGSVATADEIEFDDETAWSAETGMRGLFADGRVSLAANVFYSVFTDLQVTSFDGTTFRTFNAAEATSYGAEIEALFLPVPELELGLTAGYLKAEYDSYENAQCAATDPLAGPGCVQDLSGKPLTKSPEWSGTVSAQYTGAISNSGLSWSARADANYRSEMFLSQDLDPNSLQDGYTLVNARLALMQSEGGWEVALTGNNILDEDYLQAVYDYPFFAGSYTAQPGQPRTYGLVLNLKY